MSTSNKKILIIGGGGREHAICWKLAQSQQVATIYALPGSHGIGQVAKCENLKGVDANDFKVSYLMFCKICTQYCQQVYRI